MDFASIFALEVAAQQATALETLGADAETCRRGYANARKAREALYTAVGNLTDDEAVAYRAYRREARQG